VREKEAVTANCSLNDSLDQVDINNFVSLIPALTNLKLVNWLIV